MELGRYRHYQGEIYRVLGIARHSETKDLFVVYQKEDESECMWVRPKLMFLENLKYEGEIVPRFQFLGK